MLPPRLGTRPSIGWSSPHRVPRPGFRLQNLDPRDEDDWSAVLSLVVRPQVLSPELQFVFEHRTLHPLRLADCIIGVPNFLFRKGRFIGVPLFLIELAQVS